jgi:hypothetical protein
VAPVESDCNKTCLIQVKGYAVALAHIADEDAAMFSESGFEMLAAPNAMSNEFQTRASMTDLVFHFAGTHIDFMSARPVQPSLAQPCD